MLHYDKYTKKFKTSYFYRLFFYKQKGENILSFSPFYNSCILIRIPRYEAFSGTVLRHGY